MASVCQYDDVFEGEPKTMRKDETIWKLLKAVHGTQVASLRWQRLARGTLCEDRWEVTISVPCVGYNETKDSLVVFHGDVTTIFPQLWHQHSDCPRPWFKGAPLLICCLAIHLHALHYHLILTREQTQHAVNIKKENPQAHSGETNRDFARLHTNKKLRN